MDNLITELQDMTDELRADNDAALAKIQQEEQQQMETKKAPKLRTVNIKGKEYVEVNERIKAFRDMYPDGSIMTEIVSHQDGVCVIKAIAIIGGQIRATGHAYEKEGSTFINKTSYIENAETSAIGRCLGCLGIGIDTSVASVEEVANAIKQQGGDPF
jgi:restriction endonuclease S subunit